MTSYRDERLAPEGTWYAEEVVEPADGPRGAYGRVTATFATKLSNLLRTPPVRDEAPARVDQDGAARSAAEAVLSFLSKNF